ncbi:MAG: histidine kinase, gyrase and HSP90-like ATPase family protein [Gammaproteobacteria bacterium]|jgi:signal transduction histidine kinase|nr:histidine kinase, gyrase and HSP90-like ATPase family protein [Gammaproteobacteria bacterium]
MDSTVNLALEEACEFLEGIIALMPGHVYWKDKDGFLLGCNDEQAKSAGLSCRKDIVGKTDYVLPWKAQADALRKIDLEVMKTGKSITTEELSTLADGKEAIFLSKKVPLYSKQGEIIGILGISFDVTEQRRVERELLETRHKLEGMTLVGASIAHEIRTPLSSLEISANTMQRNIPLLIQAYEKAVSLKLDVPAIDKHILGGLKELPNIMKRETHGANTFIDMLLMNVNPELDGNPRQIFSMAFCLQEALDRYPFKPGQRELIIWESGNDFQVKGKQKLMVHILFNLLKNALFYILQDGTEHIEITLIPGKSYNQLVFMDTGEGIAPDILPHIFDKFFSKTRNGSGVGLAYCKTVMEALGGNITCESVKDRYTKFILGFPLIGA